MWGIVESLKYNGEGKESTISNPTIYSLTKRLSYTKLDTPHPI